MLVDKNGKLFGKVSVVDLVIILIVLVGLVGGYVKFMLPSERNNGTVPATFEYKVKVKAIRDFSVNYIEKSQKEETMFFDDPSMEEMGKIVSVEKKPASEQLQKADGKIVMAEIPEKYDVYVTFQVEGKRKGDNFFASKLKEIKRGAGVTFKGKYVAFESTIVDINETVK